jgi:hypothetical protein
MRPLLKVSSAFPDGFFTGIVMSSVAEYERQPKLLPPSRPCLEGRRRHLCARPEFRLGEPPGPRRPVERFLYPGHVNYFTPGSLERMVGDCGLRLKLINPARFCSTTTSMPS